MTRQILIERILRQIYNGQPTDDSTITIGLVNQWLNDAVGIAVKKNYTDGIQMDGIAYVNNSFYTTYSGLAITNANENNLLYQILLPQIPIALGKNEGVSTLQFVDDKGKTSTSSAIPLSINQLGYQDSIRPIQNKVIYWSENNKLYAKSTILLSKYTAKIRMVSGGDSTDLQSTLIVPDDYMPIVIEYIKTQLAFEKSRSIDKHNDGVDQ